MFKHGCSSGGCRVKYALSRRGGGLEESGCICSHRKFRSLDPLGQSRPRIAFCILICLENIMHPLPPSQRGEEEGRGILMVEVVLSR